MIKSFRHKGLKAFYSTGSKAGIQAKHADRLRLILARLDAAYEAEDMNLPGLRLHKLTGNFKGFWSVEVAEIGESYSSLKGMMHMWSIIWTTIERR